MVNYNSQSDDKFGETIIKLYNILRCRPFIFEDEIKDYKLSRIKREFRKLFGEELITVYNSKFRQLLLDVAYRGFPIINNQVDNKGRELVFYYINGYSVRKIGKMENLDNITVHQLIIHYLNSALRYEVKKSQESEIIEKLIIVSRKIKRIPAIHSYYRFQSRNKDFPTAYNIIKVFGSYGNALCSAFGKSSPVVIKSLYKDIDIKYADNIIKILKDTYKEKNKVVVNDLSKQVKAKIYVIFGSFKNALKEAGISNKMYY